MNLHDKMFMHYRISFTMRKACWKPTIALVLVLFALLGTTARSGDDVPLNVRIQIDPTNRIASIPEDFMGFGYETSAVAQPGFFNRSNARMIKLYGNLSQHGMIRIGGNVSDHTRYIADGSFGCEHREGGQRHQLGQSQRFG